MILYDDNLRQTIAALLNEQNPDPDHILDLLLLIPIRLKNGAVNVSKEELLEIKTVYKFYQQREKIDWHTCSNVLFVLYMAKQAIAFKKIDLFHAKNWGRYGRIYRGIICAI